MRASRGCFVSDKCVYSRSGGTIPFLVAETPEFSRIADIAPGAEAAPSEGGRTVAVKPITLEDLLTEAGAPSEIDYLSIDTEGSELAILSAFDFSRWRIRTISVEHNYTPAREALFALLSTKGYRRKWQALSLWEDWYVLDAPEPGEKAPAGL